MQILTALAYLILLLTAFILDMILNAVRVLVAVAIVVFSFMAAFLVVEAVLRYFAVI